MKETSRHSSNAFHRPERGTPHVLLDDRAGDLSSSISTAKALCASLIIIVLAAASVQRNVAWQSLLSLWEDCASKSPDKSRTRNNLGNCNLLLKRYFPAIAEYQKAVQLDPQNLEAQYNLATTLDTVGLASPAMRPYEVFCKLAPPLYAEQRALACRRLEELRSVSGGQGRP